MSDRLRPHPLRLFLCAGAILMNCLLSCLAASAQTPPKKPKIFLPALAAQGFDVKAAFGSYIVMQKGKDVWLCYMLDTKSDCTPAE
jgi:hypothetical protein